MEKIEIVGLVSTESDRALLQRALVGLPFDATMHWVQSRETFEAALCKPGLHLIIADYTAPGYSGFAALDFAKACAPEIPFIYVSSTLGVERAVEALKVGATDYVLKEHLHRLIPAVVRAREEAKTRLARKKAEESLRFSQEQFASAFENAAIGMALFEPDFRWRAVNPALCRMLGYTREELLQKTFIQITHPDDVEPNVAHLRALLAGESETFQLEKRYIHKSGQIIWGILNVSLVRDSAGRPIHLISQVQDITGRKATELQLRDIEERYRAMFDHSLEAVYLCDFEGHFLDANPAALKLLGYGPDEVALLSFHDVLYDPADAARALGAIQSLLASGARESLTEYRLRRRDGRPVWVEILSSLVFKQGQPAAVQGFARDITGRREAQEALRASEEKYRSIIENEPECVKITSPDATIVEMNSAGLRVLEAGEPSQVIGKTIRTFIHPEDLPAYLARHHEVCQGESRQLRFRIRTLSGNLRWMESHCVPLRDHDGKVSQLLSVSRDVTSARQAEEERQRLTSNLRERIKELRGLHNAAKILSEENVDPAALLQRIALTLIETTQFPELTQAAIHFGELHYQTPQFRRTPWVLTGTFHTKENIVGRVEIVYVDLPPEIQSQPFLPEERDMVNSLVEMLRVHFERQRAIERLRGANERFQSQVAAVTRLTRSGILEFTDHRSAIQEITETIAEALQVSRVSVWLYDPFESKIACEDLFTLSADQHSSGTELLESHNPPYFDAIKSSGLIVAHDAAADPRTAGFQVGYFDLHGISSMLDAPVHVGSQVAGVLCLEHVGPPREWSHDEQAFTLSAASVVSLILAQRQRILSEAKLAEQANLLNHARDAIMVCDLESRLTYWNRGAESIFGWFASEAIGRRVTDLIPQDTAAFAGACAEVLENGEWIGELEQIRKDGKKLVVDSRWALLRDPHGAAKSILCISTDITEKKKLEAQFLRTQRIESIGTLAGGIAHDLNNVLAPILMAIEMLKVECTTPESLNLLNTLQSSAERGAGLVQQILSFARGVEGQKAVLNPTHVLRELHRTLQTSFPKNIQIRLSTGSSESTVVGDATQLHQVFLNLCVNARDAMPRGGILSITRFEQNVDEVYSGMNPAAKPGPYVVIRIQDTGVGIPEEIRHQIFDPFFTTKGVGLGTGLGLATSLAIVRSHGGFIDLTTEVGKGSIFSVFLPMNSASSLPEPHPGPFLRETPRGKNQMILVVDDDDNVRTVVQKALHHFGYRVLMASHGAEALALYLQNRSEVAAVMTDMMMPIMDGPALTAALRTLDNNLGIIAFSGNASETTIDKALTAGVNEFIAKPYTAEKLLLALDKVLPQRPH